MHCTMREKSRDYPCGRGAGGDKRRQRTTLLGIPPDSLYSCSYSPFDITPDYQTRWHLFSSDLLRVTLTFSFVPLWDQIWMNHFLFSQNQESETTTCPPPLVTNPSSARPNMFSSQSQQRLRGISSRSPSLL